MWSELRDDLAFYAALRCPDGCGWLRRALLCLRSRGLLILAVQRFDHHYITKRAQRGSTPPTLWLRFLRLLARALVTVVAKADVAGTAIIDGGVYLSDRGHLIIGPQQVGRGTLIHDRVTIGVSASGRSTPVIGKNVWIGPDCVIYGEITLGDGATVLPGTVLSMSVPARTVVGGNPGTIVRTNFDNDRLRESLACDFDHILLGSREVLHPAAT
jgi:serine O-acetyltransferase